AGEPLDQVLGQHEHNAEWDHYAADDDHDELADSDPGPHQANGDDGQHDADDDADLGLVQPYFHQGPAQPDHLLVLGQLVKKSVLVLLRDRFLFKHLIQ